MVTFGRLSNDFYQNPNSNASENSGQQMTVALRQYNLAIFLRHSSSFFDQWGQSNDLIAYELLLL